MIRKYLLIYICLFSQLAWSQSYQPIERFTQDEGLTNSYLKTILKDNDGYLWVGTKNGLNRYTGYGFDQFKPDLFDKGALPGGDILQLFEDSENHIWCLTPQGISRFNAAGNSFTTYHVERNTAEKTQPKTLTAVAYNWKRNKLLIHTEDQLLYILDVATGQISPVDLPQGTLNQVNSQQLHMVYNGLHDDYYLYDRFQIIHYSPAADTAYSIERRLLQEVTADGGILGMMSDSEGENWLYSEHSLWQLDSDEELQKVSLQEKLQDEVILKVFQNEPGQLIIATTKHFLQYAPHNNETEVVLSYSLGDYEPEKINDIILPNSGIIWIATNDGLYQVNEHHFVFGTYRFSRMFTSPSPIKDVAFDGQGFLWVISEENEILVFNEFGYASENIAAKGKSGYQVLDLYKSDRRDTIFANTSSGLVMLIRKNSSISGIVLQAGDIQAFTSLGNDSLFTISSNQLRISSVSRRFKTITKALSRELNDTILDLFAHQGELYFLLPYKILKYSPGLEDTTGSVFNLSKLGLSILPQNTCILPYNTNEIILGTTNGLYVFYSYDFKVLPTYINNESINKTILAIRKDGLGQVWIVTEQGLYALQKDENKLRSFTEHEGLQWQNSNQYRVAQSRGGRLCLANKEHAVIFHPGGLTFNRKSPRVELSELKLISHRGSYTMSLFEADTIEVNNRYSLMEFHCNVLDFWDPERNQYRYSLVKNGRPDRWVELGNESSFYIPRLRPGQYKLKVMGANSSLRWSEESREIVIDVIAPFWRSKLAIFAYAVIILLLFYFTLFFTTRHLRALNREYREREQIARKVEQQKEELTQKNKNITDSLNYAKRIQMALLPSMKLFRKTFNESFILHIPKDIVSGDFYWINEVDGRIYFAAVDCTGHGVPGAFMSIIGFELFRRITEQEKKKQPAEILNSLSEGFETIFRDIENITLRDGMDVAFCAIDPEMKVLEFAGAFNPLYLIRDNTISEIKGDRFSVGLNQYEEGQNQQKFQDHVIQLKDGDVIYIFTDGYADQFGGPEGKKYKYRRFRHLLLALHQLPMERQLEFLRRSIMDWKGDLDQVDDILVMGIRINQNGNETKVITTKT